MIGRCHSCGRSVDFPPSRFRLRRVFCDKACYDRVRRDYQPTDATRAKLTAVRAARSAALLPNVQCAGCGRAFHRPHCELSTRSKHYCSLACKRKSSTGTCANCGTTITIRAGRDDRPRFCSLACNAASRRKPFIIKNGYRLVLKPEHPRADHYGYVREHIVVMEASLGRPLTKREVVHHINGNKQDNSPQNLKLFSSNSEHLRACRHIRNVQGQALLAP